LVRDVLTRTGGCLPRHFDEAELRKLFRMGQRNDCELLDRLPPRKKDPTNVGFFVGHTSTRGILHHEAIYENYNNVFGNSVVSLPDHQNKKRLASSLFAQDALLLTDGDDADVAVVPGMMNDSKIMRIDTPPSMNSTDTSTTVDEYTSLSTSSGEDESPPSTP